MDEGAAGNKPAALKAELARLKVKLAQTEDKDIRDALKLKIEATQAQIEALVPEADAQATEEAEEAVPEPSTPEQVTEAEALIRQSNLEKIRGNKSKSLDLLKQAAATAPGSAAVLEALGDDYAERKLYKEAKATYKKALALDPTNVGLERKHANLVFQTQNIGSIEDQLRMGMSDSPFINRSEALASSKAAVVYAFFIPGLAQIVVGETALGFGLMGGWVVCVFWLFLLRGDIESLVRFSVGGSGHGVGLMVIVPLFISVVIYIISLSRAMSRAKTAPKREFERPKPPVDLPFD
jgi:tetratricopeptide (TPR) repeat protein